MTGTELMNRVLKQFQVVYLQQGHLDSLLEQALSVYQAKAGPVATVTFPADASEIDTPDDYLSVAVACDAQGRWQSAVKESGKLKIVAGGSAVPQYPLSPGYFGAGKVSSTKAVKPYRVTYFQKLSAAGEVPEEGVSLLYKYLSALIEIPNNRRAREVAQATGMQGEFPDDEQLKARADLLEQEMEDCRSIIPSAAVF